MELSDLLDYSDFTNAENQHDTAAPLAQSADSMAGATMNYSSGQSNSLPPKSVSFELIFNSPEHRVSRLPMRVSLYAHDSTQSILETVKNFYGLYAGKGVSFEDENGNTLVASYHNVSHNMVVYVRVIDEPSWAPGAYGPSPYHSGLPPQHMPPPQPAQALSYGQPLLRPNSRTSRKRSTSPNQGRGRRSVSVNTNPLPVKKSRSRSGFKSRGSSAHGSFADGHSDGISGYSSGDGAPGSVSSRTKSEHIGNTEISLDNIVEGGRRKRAKFDSSVSLPRGIKEPTTLENSANVFCYEGASVICTSANASCDFKFVSLPSSSHGASTNTILFHESIATSIF